MMQLLGNGDLHTNVVTEKLKKFWDKVTADFVISYVNTLFSHYFRRNNRLGGAIKKKMLACVLVISLLLYMASCKASVTSPADSQLINTLSKTELAEKFGITELEIDDAHKLYPQIECEVSSDAACAEGEVLIIVYPFANKYSYSAHDFAEIDCVSVETLMEYRPDKADPSRILFLKFNGDVVNVIQILQERADIYCVEPNYEITLQ